MTHRQLQKIASDTIQYIKGEIYEGQTLTEIRELCEKKMLASGADSFWYYNIGAFVFAGENTTISVSGRRYKTDNYTIKKNDIITIDLSPQANHIWGDYARTIVIENGRAVDNAEDILNKEWREGLLMEERLHNELTAFASPQKTFEEIYFYMNSLITDSGYVNLDFNGNLGHSIERHKFKRIYIEKGNRQKLSRVRYFTFEPHIAKSGGRYGYKKENIYYFENGKLKKL